MQSVYKQQFTVEHIHADRFGRLTPAALLYFVQEAAGSHCRILGVDGENLNGLFWAVSRVKAEIDRLPHLGETVTLETWPMPTTRVAYPRAVIAKDRQGNVLFKVVSLWVLMDIHTRQMVLPGQSGVEVAGNLTGEELSVPRAIALQAMENRTARTVGYTLLDQNGHMNNTRYMDWVADLLPGAFHENHPVRGFTVCYLSEAREDDEISLGFDLVDDGVLTVSAHKTGDGGDTRIFSAQVLF